MQHKSVRLNDIANTIELKINVGKIKVISNDPNEESITISNEELEFGDEFTYLGCCYPSRWNSRGHYITPG